MAPEGIILFNLFHVFIGVLFLVLLLKAFWLDKFGIRTKGTIQSLEIEDTASYDEDGPGTHIPSYAYQATILYQDEQSRDRTYKTILPQSFKGQEGKTLYLVYRKDRPWRVKIDKFGKIYHYPILVAIMYLLFLIGIAMATSLGR